MIKNNTYTLIKGKRIAILISNNADFRTWNITRDKAALFYRDQSLIALCVIANTLHD